MFTITEDDIEAKRLEEEAQAREREEAKAKALAELELEDSEFDEEAAKEPGNWFIRIHIFQTLFIFMKKK